MEIVWLVAGTLPVVALLVWVLLRAARRAPLDCVAHLIPDKGGRYFHLFGTRTYMPDDGDSFGVWHHLLFDSKTRTFLSGANQKGEDLHLDSPFVERSMAQLSEAVGAPLAFDRHAAKSDDGTKRALGLPITHRDGGSTDTEQPEPLPADAFVVWALGNSPARFALELRRGGATKGRWSFPGTANFLALRKLPDKLLLLTYLRETMDGTRVGAGMAILDPETGGTFMDDFVRTGAPTRPRR